MNRDPHLPDRAEDGSVDPVSGELARYARATESHPSTSFADRVMSRIEQEAPPRRGALQWLGGAPGGYLSGLLRVGMVAAVLVIAAFGTLAAGELAGILRQQPAGTSPSVMASPSIAPTATPTPSVSPTPSPTLSPSPSATPQGSSETTQSNEPSDSVQPSAVESAGPSASEDSGGSSGHGSAEASASAQASKGSDG